MNNTVSFTNDPTANACLSIKSPTNESTLLGYQLASHKTLYMD
jgi:hypothetical protein